MNYNDLREWSRSKREVEAEHRALIQAESAAQQIKARLLTEHPGWNMYLDKLEDSLANATQLEKKLIASLCSPDTVGDAMTVLKIRLAETSAIVRTLTDAKTFIADILRDAAAGPTGAH
jgi:hypothetical protein